MTLQVQLLTMAAMIICGNVLGIIFDMYRVVSRELQLHRWLVAICDLIYWVAATLIVFKTLYETNWGEIRLFFFLGLLLGVSVYFAMISQGTIWLVHRIIAIIRTSIRWGIHLFRILIIRPLVLLFRLVLIIFGFISALSIFLAKIVIQLLYPLWRLVCWMTKPLHRHLRMITVWYNKLRTKFGRVLSLFRRRE